MIPAIRASTSTVSGAPTQPTNRLPIRRRDCIGRPAAARPSSAIGACADGESQRSGGETRLTQATGRAEREAALAMVEKLPGFGRVTLGADKGYDAKEFDARAARPPSHAACGTKAGDRVDRRTSRHPGYARLSQCGAGRRSLRLAQDRCFVAQDSSSRSCSGRLDVHLRRHSLQPGADAHADGGYYLNSVAKLRAADALGPHAPLDPEDIESWKQRNSWLFGIFCARC